MTEIGEVKLNRHTVEAFPKISLLQILITNET